MINENSPLIVEINKYKRKIKKVEDKNHKQHQATRRMSVIALISVFLSLAVLSIHKLDSFLLDNCLLMRLFENNELMTNFIYTLIVITIPVTLYLIIFSLYESSQNKPGNECNFKFYCYLLLILSLIVSILSSVQFFYSIGAFGIVTFLLCYGTNRYFGYTRAWVRNRAVRFYIEKLLSEFTLNAEGRAKFIVEIEEQKLQARFYKLVEKNIEQQQNDIVGDHISVGDATVSWIKGLKK